MRLHELSFPEGTRRNPRRVGRGIGSGRGKTAGRGQKGQKSRSGYRVRRGFEGGQMPLFRRLPKRGFTNIFKKTWAIVNVKELNRFEDETVVNPVLLKDAGIIKSIAHPVKVLAEGELSRKLTIQAHQFSKQAVEKIESAGGKAEVI
ncbi:MAG: 50S ribosomal protein L15 [Firmicutes bacterium]|nr:50S ribosomal protein L15 [Bacillota bacterium]